MFFQKDNLSKFDFISVKEFLLILFILFVTILLCFSGIPFSLKKVLPQYLTFINSHYVETFLYLICLTLTFYTIYYFSCKRKKKTLQEGLFLYPKSKKNILICILIGIIVPLSTSPILIKLAPPQFYAMDLLKEEGGLFFIIVAGLTAPILEEVFYRGFIFPFFQSKLNSFWAVIITSLFFGFSHYANIGNAHILLSLFIFYGFVLTLVRYFTNSLIPAIVTHFTHNLTLMCGALIMHLLHK